MTRHFRTALRAGALSLLAFASPACSQETSTSYADGALTAQESFPDSAWRTVDPENLLLIDTTQGTIGVELYPEIAPKHVTQVKALARDGFYDNVPFHRVIDGFMNQTGDGANGNGTGDSELPDIPAEFDFRRGEDMDVTLTGMRGDASTGQIDVGFYKALPVATQPISQSILTKDGKVAAFGLHCRGVTSAARTSDPNSANAQFFLMRGTAEHLDTQYSIWGNSVLGREHLEKFNIGTIGDGPFEPDMMTKVRIASDVSQATRPTVQVLDTGSDAFTAWLAKQDYSDICDIEIPTRTL